MVNCPVCGHDVTTLGAARCPECGTKLQLAAAPGQLWAFSPMASAALAIVLSLISLCVVMVANIHDVKADQYMDMLAKMNEYKALASQRELDWAMGVLQNKVETTAQARATNLTVPTFTDLRLEDIGWAALRSMPFTILLLIPLAYLVYGAFVMFSRRAQSAAFDLTMFHRRIFTSMLIVGLLTTFRLIGLGMSLV